MRDFQRPAGRLRALPFHARLVYTIFLAFTLAAFGVTTWLLEDMVRLDLSGMGEYYAGTPSTPPVAAPEVEPAGGPALMLPDDVDEVGGLEPMPARKLLEVTHFHLFSMPVYLLILSHLYMLSAAAGRTKTLWIALGSLGTALHVVAPWVATSGGAAATALYATSGLAMLASYLVMSVVPLWEMWAPRRTA